MEKETQGLAVAEPKKPKKLKTAAVAVAGDEPSNFIQLAIQNGASVEVMEKLFALHEKVAAERARGAYVSAISNFQSKCPIIQKTKKVNGKDGKLRYQYAPLETIIEGIKGILAENKLSYRWEVENKPDIIKATAIITHESGHSESSSFEIPIDKEGYMTAPQKYASALTYAKRYALCNALGISTGEEDVDATDQGKEAEPKLPKAKVAFLLRSLGYDTTNKKPEEVAKKITELTQLTCEKENLSEIVARLSMLVEEQQGDSYAGK